MARLSDADVIAAIRTQHLKANISAVPESCQVWGRAFVDPGGSIFGAGPYVKLPVVCDNEKIIIRVYAPERLRRRLAKQWKGR